MKVNGVMPTSAEVEPRNTLLDTLPRKILAQRSACWL